MTSVGITLLFAVYAVALLPTLLVVGPLSDQIGRKTILIPSMIIMVLASIVLAANHFAALFIGRALQGMATGAFLGTCTAAMVDHAGEQRNRALRQASFTTMIGFGLGPFTAGLLLQSIPWRPLQVPYIVHILLMGIGILAIWTVPEARSVKNQVRLKIQIGLPKAIRAGFLRFVGPAGLIFFAFNGTVIALIPSFSSQVLHVANHAIAGGLIFLMMLSGGIAQLLNLQIQLISITKIGLALTVAGAFLMITSGVWQSPPTMLVATIVEGVGNGLAFKGGLGLAGTLGTADTRAQVVSCYYIAGYTGFSVPVFVGGVLANHFGMIHGLLILAVTLGIFTATILFNRQLHF